MFTNDQITTDGLAGWPVMHPIERLRNGNGAACMPNEMKLRYDDISALGCGATTCTVTTNADGVATIVVTPDSTVLAQITASLANGAKVLAEFTGAPPSTIYALTPNPYVAIGGSTAWSPKAMVLASGLPAAGSQVLWQTTSPGVTLGAQTTTTDSGGVATEQISVSPQIGTNGGTVQACLVSTTTCVTFNVVPVHLETAEIHPVRVRNRA